MELITIIMPLYNQELYVAECIDSILSQTYEDFELIIIDNNSTDKSVDICRKYKKRDKRISIINESKQGVSNARNKGISMAKGKQIAFIDPDDTIEPSFLEKLSRSYKDNIMPVCKVKRHYKSKDEEQTIRIDKDADKYQTLEAPGISGYPVAKLYNSAIIKEHKLLFDPEARREEDNLFNYNYVKYIEKIAFIDESLYSYRMRSSSAIRGKEDIDTLHKIENFCKNEKLPMQKIEYDIIRAHLINNDKNKDYKKRLKEYMICPRYTIQSKIKLIARIVLRTRSRRNDDLFE